MGTTLERRRVSPISTSQHPLDGLDEWERYNQHISERNKLIDGKRGAEDNFVKTVIQLSSAIALLVPGFILTQPNEDRTLSLVLISGIAFIFISLVAGLSEQFFSSLAYAKQLEKTDEYYTKKSSDVSLPKISKLVMFSIFVAFLTFVVGVLLTSIALLVGPWR